MVRRHAALIAERHEHSLPRQLVPDPRELLIHRPWRVSAGKSYAEFVALPKCDAGFPHNKLGRIPSEIARPDNFALHRVKAAAFKSRNGRDSVSRGNAGDIPQRDRTATCETIK
jgi:hypothetical protein